MAEHAPNDAAAEQSAAAEPAITAEEAQAAASDALDDITMPAEAVAGEEVASAEEVLPGAAPAADEPDYKDLYVRASADMDNLRKRTRRDVGAAQDRGIGKLAKELLPAIDNLERALQAGEAAGDSSQDLVQGLRLVQAELTGALTRAGITIEDPKGRPFDPHRHEALAQTPVEGTEAGIVVEVYQPGYVLGDAVLRAARVVVSG
ncbi:MAG: nucleotide exchange factor GrpE [Solirubrobacterales bacterium]|nr:nucleotide exchange factor GrpE [Solirubrobacterales bacterium]